MSFLNNKSNQILNSASGRLATSNNSVANFGQSGGVQKNSLQAPVSLTSLVDCFTILVVYLLVATSFGVEEMKLEKGIELPNAIYANDLKLGNIVRVQDEKYFLNDKLVSARALSEELKNAFSSNDSIIIQADKNTDYAKINPVVLTALQTGFKQVKFAIIKKDEG